MNSGFVLFDHVQSALSRAISSMTGAEFKIAFEPDLPVSTVLSEPFFWQQSFSPCTEPCLWIAAGRDLWQAIGRVSLEAAGISEPSDEECRSTWQEILHQTAAALAASLSADRGVEVAETGGSVVSAEPAGNPWHAFVIRSDSGANGLLKVCWTAELAGGSAVHADGMPLAIANQTPQSKTFDLLLDIALPVAVSFGRTSLQIKEVLKLNTGSIVELDRFVTDPVEITVNNCVIARGEVVVVDGNYGVRVIHLASREERLRSGMAEAQKATRS